MKKDLIIHREIIAKLEKLPETMSMNPANAAIFYLKALEKKMREERASQRADREKTIHTMQLRINQLAKEVSTQDTRSHKDLVNISVQEKLIEEAIYQLNHHQFELAYLNLVLRVKEKLNQLEECTLDRFREILNTKFKNIEDTFEFGDILHEGLNHRITPLWPLDKPFKFNLTGENGFCTYLFMPTTKRKRAGTYKSFNLNAGAINRIISHALYQKINGYLDEIIEKNTAMDVIIKKINQDDFHEIVSQAIADMKEIEVKHAVDQAEIKIDSATATYGPPSPPPKQRLEHNTFTLFSGSTRGDTTLCSPQSTANSP